MCARNYAPEQNSAALFTRQQLWSWATHFKPNESMKQKIPLKLRSMLKFTRACWRVKSSKTQVSTIREIENLQVLACLPPFEPERSWKDFGPEAVERVEAQGGDGSKDAGQDQVGELRRHQVDEEGAGAREEHAQHWKKWIATSSNTV